MTEPRETRRDTLMVGKEWLRLERTAFADGVAVFTNGLGYEVRIPNQDYEAMFGAPEQITVTVENAQPPCTCSTRFMLEDGTLVHAEDCEYAQWALHRRQRDNRPAWDRYTAPLAPAALSTSPRRQRTS